VGGGVALYAAHMADANLPLASVAGLITVITGSEIVLAVMVGALVATWLVTTVRHAVTKPGIDDSTLSKLIEDEKKKVAHQ
jgi:hypothetical protein